MNITGGYHYHTVRADSGEILDLIGDKLEKSGYICRVADKEDTRKNIVNITEKGRSIVESSKIEFDAVDKEMFKGITEEQLKVFCEVLDICKSNLQGLDGAESDEQILKCERMEQK